VVTDRMLEMFSARKRARIPASTGATKAGGTAGEGHSGEGGSAGAAGEPR